jgi:uncharacterized protein (UPF0335 family)
MEHILSEGNVAADELRLLIERIERLEEEKKGIADDVKDVYGEAKARGYDPKTMRAIVRLRKMETHSRQEPRRCSTPTRRRWASPDSRPPRANRTWERPMAGHSKFKNIMYRKGAQDKKRSAAFSKLSREITVAAQDGRARPGHEPAPARRGHRRARPVDAQGQYPALDRQGERRRRREL